MVISQEQILGRINVVIGTVERVNRNKEEAEQLYLDLDETEAQIERALFEIRTLLLAHGTPVSVSEPIDTIIPLFERMRELLDVLVDHIELSEILRTFDRDAFLGLFLEEEQRRLELWSDDLQDLLGDGE